MAKSNPSIPIPISISTAIHRIQLSLLESPSSPSSHLTAAASILSKPDYDDVVTERTIYDLCGYPICPNPLPSPSNRNRKGRFRVSLRNHAVYDLQETYRYCSDECLVGSMAFRGVLSDERRADVDVSRSKIDGILRVFGLLEGDEEQELEEVGDLGISKLEIKEKGDVRAGEVVALDEWIGPSNAIEGYVPQFDIGSKVTSNLVSMKGIDSFKSNEDPFASTITFGEEIVGVPPRESFVMTNYDMEMITEKMEDAVIAEKKTTADSTSSKSLKLEYQTEAINNKSEKVDFSDVGFTSSIIFGNEFDAAHPEKCPITTHDISELIAKQLEDVVISEKKAAGIKTSKSFRPKSGKKASNNKSDKMDFESTIRTDNKVNIIAPKASSSSSSLLDYSNQSAKELEGNIRLENKTEDVLCSEVVSSLKKKAVTQEIALKSSLKTTGSKVGNRSVKWADERNNEALEDKIDILQISNEEDSDSSLRLASAEAFAAALSLAAEAIASGEAEAGDAVSEAGIVILPQPQYSEEGDSEADEDAFEFDQGVLKWPKKTVLLDTGMFDVEDSWHDAPPEGFSLTLSSFATMWMTLFGWVTCSSIAYIYGRDESFQEEFLLVNGREYPRKIDLRDGKSSEIRQALDGFICRALPGLVMDLRLPTPVSTLEKFVGRLLDTMSFVDALPSFKIKQWQVIVLLFIEALSVHRLPSLGPQMTSRNILLHKVLRAAQVSSEEYETMRDLFIPLGRLPQFSMQSGG